jgi:hypothetical protein
VVAFMVDAVANWLSSVSLANRGSGAGLNTAARVVARDGKGFDLDGVRFNRETHLTGLLGLAQLEVDLSQISSLVTAEPGDECVADLTIANGTEVRLRIDGSAVVSGATSLGTVRISMRDIASLTRR